MPLKKPQFLFRIIFTLILMNLLVFGLAGYSLYASKVHYEEQARIETGNLARAFEASIDDILDKIDLALWNEKAEAERQLANGGIERTSFDSHLANTLHKIPEMGEIRMAVANGDIIYGLGSGAQTIVNVADRDYFTALRDNPGGGLFISKPILGRISNKWHINLARRVNYPDGTFAGVIHGNLWISQLQKLFALLDLGKNGNIALRRNDLSMVARYPETERSTPGSVFISNEYSRLIKEGKTSGSFEATAGVDGIHRVFSFRKLDNYPLYLNCGFATQDYLSAWYLELYKQLALVVLFVFVTLASMRYVMTSWKEKLAAYDELSAARDELEHRVAERTVELQNMNDSLHGQSSQLLEEISIRKAAEVELAAKNQQLEHEISTRKQAEDEKVNLHTQLQQSQKMESLGTLAGGVAHDMNNVLGAILGLASAHIGTQPPGSSLRQALDTICKATERGGKMVKSLLSFAHQTPAENSKLDMNEILGEEIGLLERTTLAKVHLQIDLGAGLHPIQGDVGALANAFMNICVNAVDAMPENGTLTLRTRNVDSNWIEIVVEDNGTGMSKEVLEKAMDPFFTTKGVGRGTGLGLSMVFSTVKAHQGQMAIESEPGQGTRVTLRFPASKQENQVPVAEPEVDDTTQVPLGSRKVLLVDDDELMRSSVQAILEVLGHPAVTTTQSGEEALAMLEAGLEVDLVILDMNMPGLGGMGTLPRLRVLLPAVPVLLATGRVDQAALTLASAHPGVTLLSKPFGLRELQKHLENIGLG